MKVVVGFPPNYDIISAALQPEAHAIFCYGDTIYNPSDRKLSPDVEFHESIHARQQGDSPDAWYARYLTDPMFRLEQEIEAYGEQYHYARTHIEAEAFKAEVEGKVLVAGKKKLLGWALTSMAKALSGPSYGNLLTLPQAESRIRHYVANHTKP